MSEAACEVTVVIPTRNRATVLPGALRSALSQVDVSLEVTVVDDASTDATADVLDGCTDARLTHIRHERPLGVAAARNRAISEARGTWLAFLDDDDLWAPTWLRTAVDAATGRAAGAAYGSRLIVDERRHVIDAWPAAEGTQVHANLATFNALGGPSGVIVRTDVMSDVGGFDERLSALADWEAWMRVLDRCSAAPVPEFLVAYTLHSSNMHVRDPYGYLAEFAVLTSILRSRAGTIRSVDEPGLVRWLAEEVARAGRRGTAARLWLHSAVIARRPQDVLRAGLALTRERVVDGKYAASPAWLAALDCDRVGAPS